MQLDLLRADVHSVIAAVRRTCRNSCSIGTDLLREDTNGEGEKFSQISGRDWPPTAQNRTLKLASRLRCGLLIRSRLIARFIGHRESRILRLRRLLLHGFGIDDAVLGL